MGQGLVSANALSDDGQSHRGNHSETPKLHLFQTSLYWQHANFRTKTTLLPQDLLQGFSLRQLIDQLVQIANFPHERFFDVLDPNPAYQALYQRPCRIQLRRLCEERFEGFSALELRIELLLAVSG